jgi:hypothetical protein
VEGVVAVRVTIGVDKVASGECCATGSWQDVIQIMLHRIKIVDCRFMEENRISLEATSIYGMVEVRVWVGVWLGL